MEAIRGRRSVRAFCLDPVPRPLIEQVLEAGALAPSAKNMQNWRFVVLQGTSKARLVQVLRDQLDALPADRPKGSAPNSARIMDEAPVLIVVFNTSPTGREIAASRGNLHPHSAEIQGVAAAIQSMLLAAFDAGLGSLWICDVFYAAQQIECHLEPVVGQAELVAAISPGYPASEPRAAAKRGWREATCWPEE
ncbi:MAG: nitroreductase family protein [Bacillota bacterium]|nr:nitroreductase family protein [Bacillota bacterium]